MPIIRNIMPARSPVVADTTAAKLIDLGQNIRAHRKALRLSAIVVAEAAGLSRVTLHRIENGEPSVTMGAYSNVMEVLGLDFGIIKPAVTALKAPVAETESGLPARINLADYPQLRQLAWQVQGTDALTPTEALTIYERNWRHVDVNALEAHEKQLLEALRLAFGGLGGYV